MCALVRGGGGVLPETFFFSFFILGGGMSLVVVGMKVIIEWVIRLVRWLEEVEGVGVWMVS